MTIAIVISGNPVLVSRSFRATVNTRLDNYLGNLSNITIMDEKVAQSIRKQSRAGCTCGQLPDGVMGGHLAEPYPPQRTSLPQPEMMPSNLLWPP